MRMPGQQPPEKGATLKQYVSIPSLYASSTSGDPTSALTFGFFPIIQSVDLTDLAKQGKLDPTIGRDEGKSLHRRSC